MIFRIPSMAWSMKNTMNWRRCERKRPWRNLMYNPGICVGETEEIHEETCQVVQLRVSDPNREPPEDEAGILWIYAECYVSVDCGETGFEAMDWTLPTTAPASTSVLNLRVPQEAGNFLTDWGDCWILLMGSAPCWREIGENSVNILRFVTATIKITLSGIWLMFCDIYHCFEGKFRLHLQGIWITLPPSR